MKYWIVLIWISFFGKPIVGLGQTLPAGFPVLEELARRNHLTGGRFGAYSFTSRPIRATETEIDSLIGEWGSPILDSSDLKENFKKERLTFEVLPLLNTTVYNSNRPVGWGNSSLLNSAGLQNLTSPGIFFKFHFLEVQLRPEFVFSENKSFEGFGDSFSDNAIFARFRFWNFGDHPEKFGDSFDQFATWGQSYISLSFGKAELGFSTQNIWWGPGQFSGLIFSNNARGMKHFYLKTKSPANIGIGLLEAQVIFGKAEDSGLAPTQNSQLNSRYFLPFSGDWRYLNGISLAYQPSFLKGLTLGFNRTFQQYNGDVEEGIQGRIPVFEAFQKEKLFENGNSVNYDKQAQDQQVSVFFKFKSEKGKFEIYSEFGKQDHNFDWREFVLNPEHARAYLIGFQKLVQLPKPGKFLQIRAEIVQQQESVNRYIRYSELGVLNTSWHTHYQVRGFTNFGESMGTGIGVGANAQIAELAIVKGISKVGLLLQRIENHQDFYYQVQSEIPDQNPWIDFSGGLIWNFQWKKMIISTTNQVIYATNYQWKGDTPSTVDFKGGHKKYSFSSNLNLIYRF